ncbi:MAG: hypothetical protein M3Z23_16530, partial [Acidobacteriota bacterium]|nr:hypothetical protein [Acidobacteriota bacterium]
YLAYRGLGEAALSEQPVIRTNSVAVNGALRGFQREPVLPRSAYSFLEHLNGFLQSLQPRFFLALVIQRQYSLR